MANDPEKTLAWRELIVGAAVVTAVWAILVFVFGAGGPRDYWFEDDPFLFGFARDISNPLAFFFRHDLVAHAEGQAEIIPMLFVSFWVDLLISPTLDALPAIASTHSALSTLLAALIFGFYLWRRLPVRVAVGAACLWLLLPSTQATLEFVSTRCYQEGLIFALASLMYAEHYLVTRTRGALVATLVLAALAMLSKELYLASLPALLAFAFFDRRAFRALASLSVVCAAIAAHRIWAVGLSVRYGMDAPRLTDVFAFVRALPRASFGTLAGYTVWGAVGGFGAWVLRQQRDLRGAVVRFLVVGALSFATLLPITHGVLQSGKGITPWARSLFVINTLVVFAAAWVYHLLAGGRARRVVAICVFAIGAHACLLSIDSWNHRKEPFGIETRFVLTNPGKVLVSSLEAAPWYYAGIDTLYADRPRAAVVHRGTTVDAQQAMANRPWFTLKEGAIVSCAPEHCAPLHTDH